ncbi:tape measure protein [Lactobacillus amylovorus]|uniref:aggregation-promoting factor C-terminal-like domain-containing protein n=1 Tax=Lactobacillus amylovorus TaxID=1604 RepID=UPI002330CE50|nr:tape measure protein [Lactobacillus amylovorus]MDB6264820.1 tape measure protein [Lactobacillus amylovorus]
MKINNIMSTTIDINTIKASNSLKSLDSAIRATTNAWKANEARARSVGSSLDAAKSRYEGLGKNIDNVKSKIRYLTEQQSKLDTSTKQGQEEYNKYVNKLASAEKQLASMTAQQKRARNSLSYESSGLAELQKHYKETSSLNKSYVDRLESEGKTYLANKARVSGYRNSIANLTKQYEAQSKELSRIASESGRTSSAYKLQQIRVNETATAINKAKSAVSGLESENRKLNPSVWDKIRSKLSGVNEKAVETHKTLKEVFMGSALGNAVSNAASNLGSSLKSAYEEGMQLNLGLAKINGRFKSMGMNNREIKALDKQIGELKANTDLAGDSASDLQAHMLNWSIIGTKGAMQMARTVAGIGDSSKLSGQQIAQLSASLMRVGSTGKVTYSSLSRITKAAPSFMETLARGAGMSQSKLRGLLKTGNVTQKQFQTWLASASKYADESFKGYSQTQAGALKSMTVARQKLEQEFTKPIFDAKTSGLQALKDIMTSKEVMSGANQLGKAISNTIGYLDKHKADITGVTKDVVSLGVSIGKETWKDATGIFMDIGKSFGLISGNAKKSKDPLHVLKLSMDGLVKNKTAIQWISKAIIAMAAAKGISHVGMGLLGVANNGYKAYKNIKALRNGFKGLQDIKDLKGSEHAFAHLGQTIGKLAPKVKGLFNQKGGAGKLSGLLQSAHSAGGFSKLSTAGKIGTGLAGAGVAVDTATSIVKAIKDRVGSRKQYEDVGTAAGKGIGGAIGLYFGGPAGAAIGAKIGGIVGKWGGDAVKSFQNGWNKKKPPRKFWSFENLGWSTHDTFKKVGKWGSDVGKKLGQGLAEGKSFAKKNSKELALTAVSPLLGIPALLYKNNPKFRKWVNSVGKNIKGGLKTAGKAVNNFKNSLGKNFKKAWDQAYKHSSKGTKQIMRSVSKFAKNYVKVNSKANNDTLKNFSSFGSRLKKNHGNLFKTLGQTAKTQLNIEKKRWSANWKNVKSTASGIWKGLNKNASDMYKKLNSATHGGLGKVLGGFKDFGKSIKDFWSGLWKGVTKTFDDTIKDLQNAAGNVKKFFTGKLKVGNIHLASGTDWRKRWGYPAILNDGNDSPQTGNREGLIHNDGSLEVLNGRNIKRWIFPGQEIINAHDLAALFGRGIRLANGTFSLRNLKSIVTIKDPSNLLKDLNKITKKSYELNKKKYSEAVTRHEKQKQRHDKNDQNTENERKRLIKKESEAKAERAKLQREIRTNLAKGRNTKGLVAQFNALDEHISKIKKDIAKTNPHHGQTLVDEGLLIGAKSRIGKSKWISTTLFKKLIANLNKKNKKTKKRKTKRRKTKRRSSKKRKSSSSISRSTSSRRSSSASLPRVSSQSVSVKATVSGLSSVKGLARAISAIKSKSVKISAKGSSTKTINSLAKAVKKVKGGTHKLTVKVKGTKAVNSLYKATKKIKGKTHKVTVKTSGTKSLKSLQSHISAVTKKVKSLNGTAKKSHFGKNIAKQAEDAVKSLKGKGNFAKQFESMTKKFDKDLKSMTQKAKKEFNSMWSSIEKSSNAGKNKNLSILSSFSHKFTNDWRSLENGVHRTFGRFWLSMANTAGKGVNAVIRILNNAIGKIDSVIADFGGSKHAVSRVGLVRYATGTGWLSGQRRAITKPTFAMLNDGNDSPETKNQEVVWTPWNNTFDIVPGRNTPALLMPGQEIFNATESKHLGFTHFAAGTGYLKKLYDEAKHNWTRPTKTGQGMFGAISGLTGAVKELAQGMKSKGEDQGVKWWSQLWKMVDDKVNDGDLGPAKGLLKAVEKLGHGKPYITGGYGVDANGYDCSGLVSTALEHYFHSGWGHQVVSGLWTHATKIPRSEAKPGDPVFWNPTGSGDNAHIGIYAGHGMYYSAYGPGIGMKPLSWGVSGYKPVFGRFKGINEQGSSDKDKVEVKANNKLQKFIKPQVGTGFWKTIQKIADKYGEKDDGDIAGKPSGDHAHWLKEAHIPKSWWNAMTWIIDKESHWDPKAYNPQPTPTGHAYGIAQITSMQWQRYYAKHGHDWKSNPIAQLMGMRDYIKDRYGNADHAKAFWQAHGWYADGGIVSSPQLAMVGEGAAPETIIPWDISKRSRAYQLLGTTLAKFKSEDGQSYSYVDQEQRKEEHDFMQAVLLLLRQIAAKSEVADIKLTTPQGRTLWEVVEPFSKAEQRAEMIKLRRGLSGR